MELSDPAPVTRTRRSGGFWPVAPTRSWWHHAAGLPVLALLGWLAFVRGSRVPVLGWLDLAVHEFGHVWTMWLPRVVNLAMGSGTQVLLPLGIAAGLWWKSRDPLGTALALGWAGTSAQDASRYIADAPFQRLPLIGGVHDWGTLLGPGELNALWAADDLGRLAWLIGLALWVTGVGIAGWRAWHDHPSRAATVDPLGDDEPPPSTWSLPAR